MAHQNIVDLEKDMDVDSEYLIVKKGTLIPNKNNDKWRIQLELRDKSAFITAFLWGFKNELEKLNEIFDEGDVVKIKGKVGEYNGELTININYQDGCVEKMEANADDYMTSVEDVPWLNTDMEALEEEFWDMVNRVRNENLRALLYEVFKDENFWNEFKRTPASLSIHSPFVGGLLHHTVNVAKIAMAMAERYPSMDMDLVIAGALLHDIGKVKEYEITYKFEETENGGLHGHLFLGAEMLKEKCESMGHFPDGLKRKLIHIVLSHHGKIQQGWGSAKDPMFPEAVAISMADLADAQIFTYVEKIENARISNEKSKFVKDKHLGWLYTD